MRALPPLPALHFTLSYATFCCSRMCAIHFLYVFDGMSKYNRYNCRVLFQFALGRWRQLAGAAAALWDREYNAPGNTHNIHLSWRSLGDVRPALPDLTSELEGGQRSDEPSVGIPQPNPPPEPAQHQTPRIDRMPAAVCAAF